MRKVATIGIGACGANITLEVSNLDNYLVEQGFDEIYAFNKHAINSTEFDMTFLEGTDVKVKTIGGNGCGKSRVKSKRLFKNVLKEMIPAIANEIIDCDIIVVEVGLGGGTGSGIIAMFLDILRNQLSILDKNKRDRIYIAIGAIPRLTEDLTSLRNAIEAITEINSINIPYCLIDNELVTGSIKDVYEATNRSVAMDLQVIRGDFNAVPSKIRNMDERDCFRLFSTPGLMTINKISNIKEVDLDKLSIDDLIVRSIKDSYNVQIEKDKVLGKIGVIMNLTEAMLEKFDESLEGVQKEVGKTPFKFIHVNIVENEAQTSIITVLTGLSCPDSKLAEMSEIINQAKSAVNIKKESKVGELNAATNWLNDDEDEDELETTSMDDMMGKWDI